MEQHTDILLLFLSYSPTGTVIDDLTGASDHI